ncbi:NAD-P-binding protein [Russula earlei]|uniref:NAD-P-binding protein n=2 Tax=Russula earlei TaxID=71964 RepID=A0ACC0TVR6_9AGAM|nr:NAD-P-binding protein [Russula earlei]KAI9451093.1 NAD-P-binding protein [Russula earlei]
MSFLGLDEDLKVSSRGDIYPTIDPKVHYDAQTFSGKVVLITGASRGIGAEIALQYARAGAKLSLVARTQAALDAIRDAILRERPTAQILTSPADVRDVTKAGEIVASTVARFGRLDILVSNAAILRRMDLPFASKDPKGWWDVVEVNIRGTYNFIHFAVPELLKTKGQLVILTSVAAQMRIPTASEYCVSKFALNRLAEFVTVEYPDIKVFAVHPGGVKTDMYAVADTDWEANATVGLSAATILYLTSGNADYLNGRYVSSTWDLGEVERDWKEKILAQNGLVSKLSIPV